jgi:hypothetical protein
VFISDFPLLPTLEMNNPRTGELLTLESLDRNSPRSYLVGVHDLQNAFGNRQVLRVRPACGPMKHNDLADFSVGELNQVKTLRFA